MRWPVDNAHKVISSRFSRRRNPITGEDESHRGLDFAVSAGAPLYAVEDGTVLYARRADGFGNWVVLRGKSGFLYIYGHMWEPTKYVREGQSVKEGMRIADAGSAGQSTGPHLHFEVMPGRDWVAGSQVDPFVFLADRVQDVKPAASGNPDRVPAENWTAVVDEFNGKGNK